LLAHPDLLADLRRYNGSMLDYYCC